MMLSSILLVTVFLRTHSLLDHVPDTSHLPGTGGFWGCMVTLPPSPSFADILTSACHLFT